MRSKLKVNIENIVHNIELIRNNSSKEVCIPVKGNAYGMGLGIIDELVKKGYDFFGVSTLEEALFIRKKYSNVRILIFSAIFPEEIKITRKNKIMITVYENEMLELLNKEDLFHLKFDIGMGRIGFFEKDIKKIKELLDKKNIVPVGLYSHLPKPDDEIVTKKEIQKFEKILKEFQKFKIKYIHLHSSLAALKYKTTFDNLIRPGLLAYGYYGDQEQKEKYNYDIRPGAELYARISLVKNYDNDISYDLIEHVNGRVATITIGYHDGIFRRYQGYHFNNSGKIVGKICMCQLMIKIDEGIELKRGDYIEIFGENNSIYGISQYTGLSVYELLSGLTERITREYK